MVARQGRDPPITANRRHPREQNSRIKSTGPRMVAPGRQSLPTAEPERLRGTTTCRQWRSRAGSSLPLLRRRAQPASGGIVASMSEPVEGEFRRDPPAGWSEAPARAGAAAGAFLSILCRHKKGGRPPGRPGQSPPTEGPENEQQGQCTGPRPAPGRRIVTDCQPGIGGTDQPAGNGEAEPAAASPSAAPSAACGSAGIVASMSEPEGEFRRDPPGSGGARAPARAGAAAGAFYPPFLSPQERWSPAGRDPANHRQPKARHQANDKDQRHWTPACAGATNRGRPPNPMT